MELSRRPTQRSESTPEATDELHDDAMMEKMAATFPRSYGKLGNRRKCADGSGIEVVYRYLSNFKGYASPKKHPPMSEGPEDQGP